MSDRIEVKTEHKWVEAMGWDAGQECQFCRVNAYDTRTKFCEDVAFERQERLEKKERRHAATEAAWNRAREVLTREEWDLMELRSKHSREYRVVDRITI